MNHLPLRQMVRGGDDAARLFACQRLLDALSRPGRFQVLGHGGGGGEILASRELALAEAQVALRQACGDGLAFGAVTVHARADGPDGALMVPVMFLRIDVPRAHRHALLRLLQERAIETQEMDLQRDRLVVRAEVPLARLLGLERLVGELTDGSAHTMCWLLRYEPAAGSSPRAPSAAAPPARPARMPAGTAPASCP